MAPPHGASPSAVLLLLLLLVMTFPATSAFEWLRVVPSDPVVYAVTYHTPTATYIPGCARTFTFVSLPTPTSPTALVFNLSVHRLSPSPLISSQSHSSTHLGGSVNLYNFNAAYVPLPPSPTRSPHVLLVRAQNASTSLALASPSRLFLAFDTDGQSNFADIMGRDLSFFPVLPDEDFGTEDPRVVYNPADKRWSTAPPHM